MANEQVKVETPVTASMSDADLSKLAGLLAYHAGSPAWVWGRILGLERDVKRLELCSCSVQEAKLKGFLEAQEEKD